MAPTHADPACGVVHRQRPRRDRSGLAFAQHRRPVIGRNIGDPEQKVVDPHPLACIEEHRRTLATPLARDHRAHGEHLRRIEPTLFDQFEGEIERHHLGDRGRHEAPVGVAGVEHLAAGDINQNCHRRLVRAGDRREHLLEGKLRARRHSQCAEQDQEQCEALKQNLGHAPGYNLAVKAWRGARPAQFTISSASRPTLIA